MINLEAFLDYLTQRSFTFATGVPCSFFSELIPQLVNNLDIRQIPATREDEAVGIATGISIGGKRSLLYMQNSGFATIGDALTSLAQLYEVPLLILVSWRGLEVDSDFPEHVIMGSVTTEVMDAYQLPYWNLQESKWKQTMDKAITKMEKESVPVCLLVEKGVFC